MFQIFLMEDSWIPVSSVLSLLYVVVVKIYEENPSSYR